MSTHPERPHAMKYPEDHPLYGRDAQWIAARAEHVGSFNTAFMAESQAALAHEYRRLKADVSSLETLAHPPTDWLTRAIELSGAESDADWGDLLKRIEWLGDRTPNEHLKHLRERAEAAEDSRDKSRNRVKWLEAEVDRHVSRADALRHFNAGPQVNPITPEVQDGRWVNTVSKSRWSSELKAWESVGMVNGWIGTFDDELPDCVADKCEAKARNSESNPTPPLDRIAADVAKIAANVERMVADA